MNFSTELENMALEFTKRSRLEVMTVTGAWGTLCVFALIGNLLTLTIVCRNRALWAPTNMLISSLALADLGFVGLSGIPLGTVTLASGKWPFTSSVCQYLGFSAITLVAASITTLACTAVNRYYRVVRTTRYKQIFTSRSSLGIIAVAWVLAFLAPVPYIASGHKFVFHPAKGFCYLKIDSGLFTAILVSIYIGIPSVLICYSYLSVFLVVRRHKQDLSRNNTIDAATLKTTNTLFVIVFVFMCCWTPVLAIDLIDTLSAHWVFPRVIYIVYSFLCLTSSLVNPLIYGIMNPNFRKEYLNILKCRVLFRKSRVAVQGTRFIGSSEKM